MRNNKNNKKKIVHKQLLPDIEDNNKEINNNDYLH